MHRLDLHAATALPRILWLALLALIIAGCSKPVPQPIHGYVDTRIRQGDTQVVNDIALPDIAVTAKNTTTGVLSAAAHTDPYGYFRTQALPPGSYNICVSGTGYVSRCDTQVVAVSDHAQVLNHVVLIEPQRSPIVGTVRLADKTSPCFWYDPAFDANYVMTARISLTDSGGTVVAGPIRGNNLGQYVVPGGAAAGTYKLAVSCEKEQAADTVALAGGPLEHDFVLGNHAPSADLLVATKAGIGVRRASPGDNLKITASSADVDGDVLHYRWVDESRGTAGFPDASGLNWPAPAPNGPHAVRVLISDDRGGYAVRRTIINVGPDEMLFSGIAFNRTTHVPVPGAAVTLNGVATTTDSQGGFEVKVPDKTRFVLNVGKPGFALTSRIFFARATGIQVPLDPAQTTTIDGGAGGTVAVAVWGCKQSNSTGGQDCDKEQIGTLSLVFPAGALVSGGTPYTGPATVEAFQFDLTLPNAIPGDQSATHNGADARLETYGAIHVQPRDASGNPLQMAPGKTVAVSMPIHPLALATAPATIPFFRYEESSGLWVDHGTLTRSGNNYVGKIAHFSAFNADSSFGSSSCMKIQLDQEVPTGFPASVVLNASYVTSGVGTFNHPNQAVNDTQNPIVIERLIPNQDFKLTISYKNGSQTVLLNSGPPVSVPYPVPFPYDGCKPAVVFNSNLVPPTGGHFLIGATIVDNSADYKTQTTTGKYAGRDTFPGWQAANGFTAAATQSHAVYFNNGDLQFGRNMNCRKVSHTGTPFAQDWTACYVSNFGQVGVDFSQQPVNPLQLAYANQKVAATVAMEYHPDQTDKVQFWAFRGDATGSYFANPALDVEGNKPMPDMCQGCHQGSYGGAGALANNSVFLPFDIDSFIGDDGTKLQNTLGGGGQRPTQEDFRQLNQFVLQASNIGTGVNPAFQRLMDIWYKDGSHANGVNDAGATYHFDQGAAALNANTANSFPAAHLAIYDDVVRPVCRTCHIARTEGFDTWDKYAELTGYPVQDNACGPGNVSSHHTMPLAQVPYKRFWETNLETTLGSELGVSCPP